MFLGTKKLYSIYDTETLITGRQKVSLIEKLDVNIDEERRLFKEWWESLPPLIPLDGSDGE